MAAAGPYASSDEKGAAVEDYLITCIQILHMVDFLVAVQNYIGWSYATCCWALQQR